MTCRLSPDSHQISDSKGLSLFSSRTNKTFHTSCYVIVGISMSSAEFESAEVAKIVEM